MHRDIGNLPNAIFYEGLLKTSRRTSLVNKHSKAMRQFNKGYFNVASNMMVLNVPEGLQAQDSGGSGDRVSINLKKDWKPTLADPTHIAADETFTTSKRFMAEISFLDLHQKQTYARHRVYPKTSTGGSKKEDQLGEARILATGHKPGFLIRLLPNSCRVEFSPVPGLDFPGDSFDQEPP